MELDNLDGLVKRPIYVVVGLTRRLVVPYVPSHRRVRHYFWYIELFPESVYSGTITFHEINNLENTKTFAISTHLDFTKITTPAK